MPQCNRFHTRWPIFNFPFVPHDIELTTSLMRFRRQTIYGANYCNCWLTNTNDQVFHTKSYQPSFSENNRHWLVLHASVSWGADLCSRVGKNHTRSESGNGHPDYMKLFPPTFVQFQAQRRFCVLKCNWEYQSQRISIFSLDMHIPHCLHILFIKPHKKTRIERGIEQWCHKTMSLQKPRLIRTPAESALGFCDLGEPGDCQSTNLFTLPGQTPIMSQSIPSKTCWNLEILNFYV